MADKSPSKNRDKSHELQQIDEKAFDEKAFSESRFWDKLKKHSSAAGKEVIEAALKLFYAWRDPDTPGSAKTIILGALVYFIVPTDAVMDFLPGGYVDDWGALLGALWTVARHVKDEHTARAQEKLKNWFPAEGEK